MKIMLWRTNHGLLMHAVLHVCLICASPWLPPSDVRRVYTVGECQEEVREGLHSNLSPRSLAVYQRHETVSVSLLLSNI